MKKKRYFKCIKEHSKRNIFKGNSHWFKQGEVYELDNIFVVFEGNRLIYYIQGCCYEEELSSYFEEVDYKETEK